MSVKQGPKLMMRVPASKQTVRKPKKKAIKKKISPQKHLPQSHHGMRLALGLGDPFHEQAVGLYCPDEVARSSLKICGRTRLQLTLAANSTYIFFPQTACANNAPMGFSMTGTSATVFPATYSFATAPAGVTYTTLINPSLPFSQNTLYGNEAAYRFLSLGIKVNYTGSKLNQGGTMLWVESTGNSSLLDQTTIGSETMTAFLTRVRALNQARVMSFITSDSHVAVYTPLHRGNPKQYSSDPVGNATFTTEDIVWSSKEDDIDWLGSESRFGNTSTGQYGLYPKAALVLQSGSSSLDFLIEFITHAEVAGGSFSSLGTPSPPHIEDSAMVLNAVSRSKQTHAHSANDHPMRHLSSILGKNEGVIDRVAHAALKGAMNLASNPQTYEKAAQAFSAMFL